MFRLCLTKIITKYQLLWVGSIASEIQRGEERELVVMNENRGEGRIERVDCSQLVHLVDHLVQA